LKLIFFQNAFIFVYLSKKNIFDGYDHCTYQYP